MGMLLQIWRGITRIVARVDVRWGRSAQHLFRWGIPILLLVFLGYSLTQLGWNKVLNARPATMGFYIIVLLPFFIQPIADLIIYRNLLGVGRALPLVVLFRKRYMNSIMLDYSGEVFFYFWAKKNLNLRKGLLLHAVKDSNVLSASAGLAIALLMLAALAIAGIVKLSDFGHHGMWTAVFIATLPLILGFALFVGGRRVTALSRGDIALTFGMHVTRSIVQLALEFAIWWSSGALPSAAVCLEFVALRLLVTRLPFVPNKDLVFIGVGLVAAGVMDVSTPKVAAVLVLTAAIGLIQDFVLVGAPWLLSQFQLRRNAGQTAT